MRIEHDPTPYAGTDRMMTVGDDGLPGDLGAVSTSIGDATPWLIIPALGGAAAAYHGYKRNNGALGWTAVWAVCGALAPIIAIPVALAQGFGKRR